MEIKAPGSHPIKWFAEIYSLTVGLSASAHHNVVINRVSPSELAHARAVDAPLILSIIGTGRDIF
ncbi:MAG: hypothetical protein ACTJHT_14905 [Sphingobacterium sp.]|uniref:hypothetical protein n=1 Tax=Sphingobacterium sp. JB170 TaxID=1434842 RepID=UPI000B3607E5|nr:hypothetical protein [Sphingobacterium sp. JB170]